jgi:hypothetical protein
MVDLTASAQSGDDLLSDITSLARRNRSLEPRFGGKYFFVELRTERRKSRFDAQDFECFEVAVNEHIVFHSGHQSLLDPFPIIGIHPDLETTLATETKGRDENVSTTDPGFGPMILLQVRNPAIRDFLEDRRGFRAFEAQCDEFGTSVDEHDIVCDDIALERLANSRHLAAQALEQIPFFESRHMEIRDDRAAIRQ